MPGVVYDRDHLPGGDWREFRKTATTRMVRVQGPCQVVTREGAYNLPKGWDGYIALDSGGYPYPIGMVEHAAIYEPVR